jgi:hypothetical protein
VCCLLVLLAFFTPRIVLFLLFLFSSYLASAFDTWLWPTLGFFFLPATTIGYAIAQNEFGGFNGLGIVAVVIGLAVDVGLLGGGARQRRTAG